MIILLRREGGLFDTPQGVSHEGFAVRTRPALLFSSPFYKVETKKPELFVLAFTFSGERGIRYYQFCHFSKTIISLLKV